MDSKIKENAGFYAVGILSTIIAILGITANTLYLKTDGYALGVGLSLVALICEFFVFAISPKIVKVRAKGMIASSMILTIVYSVAFIVCDIANVKAYSHVFESGVFVSKLTGFGKFVFAFEILCIVYVVLSGIRMLLNLFGKEFKFYEKILGTEVVRYKEKPELVLDLPEKDTDKLITTAKRTLNSNQKLVKALEESVVEDEPTEEKTEKSQPVENKIVREVVEEIEQEEKAIESTTDEQTEEAEESGDVPIEQEKPQENVDEDKSEVEEATNENDYTQEQVESEEVQENAETPEENESDEAIPSELYADSHDVGGVVNEYEQNEDFRNTCLVHHITEQVENADDDIYNDFDYDD